MASHFGRHRDAERYLRLPGLGPVPGHARTDRVLHEAVVAADPVHPRGPDPLQTASLQAGAPETLSTPKITCGSSVTDHVETTIRAAQTVGADPTAGAIGGSSAHARSGDEDKGGDPDQRFDHQRSSRRSMDSRWSLVASDGLQ
jgi:hypothetical protein